MPLSPVTEKLGANPVSRPYSSKRGCMLFRKRDTMRNDGRPFSFARMLVIGIAAPLCLFRAGGPCDAAQFEATFASADTSALVARAMFCNKATTTRRAVPTSPRSGRWRSRRRTAAPCQANSQRFAWRRRANSAC